MTPRELRSYAEIAILEAKEWRKMAEKNPSSRERYIGYAREREEHGAFYLAKAYRDEAWNGTEDYLEKAE